MPSLEETMQAFMADTMEKAYAQHRTDIRHKTGAPTTGKNVKSALHRADRQGAAPQVWRPKTQQKAPQGPQPRRMGPPAPKSKLRPLPRPQMDDNAIKPILYDMLMQEAVRGSVPQFDTSTYDRNVEPDTYGYIQRAQERDQAHMDAIGNALSMPFAKASDAWGYVTAPGGHR